MHYGNPEEIEMEEWWNEPIEVLQDNLRNNVQQEDKENIIRLAMGVVGISTCLFRISSKNNISKIKTFP